MLNGISVAWMALLLMIASPVVAGEYVDWQKQGDAIDLPLAGLAGDATRGLQLVRDIDKGNCVACHVFPIADEEFMGDIGPPLDVLASRLSEAQIRLRVVDQKQVNPDTIMPGYYRDPRLLSRVADEFYQKPYLTAQEVEDIVAYLLTLK